MKNYIVELNGKYLSKIVVASSEMILVDEKEYAELLTKDDAIYIQNNLGGTAVRYDS